MTPDLTEQRLREQLTAAADGESDRYPEMDVDTLLARGELVLRRRRLALLAGAAVAGLVLAFSGWAVLSDRSGEDRTLPATISTVDESVTELDLGAIPQTGRVTPLVAEVGVDEVSGSLDFLLRTDDGAVLASRSSVPGGMDEARWATMIPGLTVALLPIDATGAAPIWIGEPTEQGSAATRTPDGRMLVAWWTVGSSYETFCDVIWTDGKTAFSAYHDVSLPSVVMDDTVFFFGSVGPTYLGFIGPSRDGGVLGTAGVQLALNVPPDHLPAVWADAGDSGPVSSGARGLFATRTPVADGEASLETIGDAKVRLLTTHELGGPDGLMLVAVLDGPRGSVAGVTYADPRVGTVTGITDVE